MAPSLTSRKKAGVKAGTSDVKDSGQSATVRRRKWLQSLSEEKRNEIRLKDRLRKKQERAKQRENRDGHVQDTTMPPQVGSSRDIALDIDVDDEESDGPVIATTLSRPHRVSRLVRVDSDTSDTERDELAAAPNTKSHHIASTHLQMDYTANGVKDLTVGVVGRKLPAQSATVQWPDGRITVLPTIIKKGVNICESVDVQVVKFFASFPESTPSSKHVLHLSAAHMERDDIIQTVECSLRDNKPVVIRGNGINAPAQMTTDWLDHKFGINPDMPVSIHDAEARVADSAHPHKPGTISSLVAGMNDPTKIQCVLDLPYVHGGLPERLRNLDHGRRFGWSQTTQQCPIREAVHPDNFTSHFWALLHQAGYVSFAHHDADGVATYIRIESGGKMWIFFRLKSQKGGRTAYANSMMKLVGYPDDKEEVHRLWDAEVVYLGPGDLVIQPPGQVHGAYTPVEGFATGASFFNLASMHLSERARYMDHKKADFLTNQTHAYSYALETMRRIAIAVPHLSKRIPLYRRSLMSLCLMVIKCQDYIAADVQTRKIQPSETAFLAEDICRNIVTFLGIKNIGSISTTLFRDRQDIAGEPVDRDLLWGHLARFREDT
ncbi:hypothetical protein DFJ58DRAFT_736948 [Suillus subalutaceus]|uniref:uncharacterized protein n=1 Tax=Suillus subalutaceus TaxID=48586 RepID=UPI001B86E1EB|nr:uncharacterized protein DFJ58DRAFT_736948 [Suillus subalutaceus]KAG1830492.1 hypothetical protein DFJ58DRAFT_736948 [Suillus subalutaceus]